MKNKTWEERFDEEFPQDEILEVVDIGEGQGDVVPIGIKFREPLDPDKIKNFINSNFISKEDLQELLEGIKKVGRDSHTDCHCDICMNDTDKTCPYNSYNQALKDLQNKL